MKELQRILAVEALDHAHEALDAAGAELGIAAAFARPDSRLAREADVLAYAGEQEAAAVGAVIERCGSGATR
jgi:hypothetical protein